MFLRLSANVINTAHIIRIVRTPPGLLGPIRTPGSYKIFMIPEVHDALSIIPYANVITVAENRPHPTSDDQPSDYAVVTNWIENCSKSHD